VRSAGLSLLLLLGACSTPQHPFRELAAIEEQIAINSREQPDDAHTMAQLRPGQVVREGRTLTIRTGARTFRFVDQGYCEGFASCERSRVDRLFHGRFLGISQFTGEYPDSYFIIDLARGRRLFDTGERPVPAPSGPLAAVADSGEANQPVLGGFAVVDLKEGRVLLHRPEHYPDARIDRWEGERCVRASYRPDIGSEARRTIWFTEFEGRWLVLNHAGC